MGLPKKIRFFIFLTIGVPFMAVPIGVYQLIKGQVSWIDAGLFLVFYLFSLLGVTLGLHRLFSHRAFTAGSFVKWFLAIAGSQTWQGNLFNWVAEHRLHHAMSDQKGDFHSPLMHQDGTLIRGKLAQFAHSHFLWFFRRINRSKYKIVRDLMRDKALVFINDRYLLWSALSILTPAVLGWCFYGGKMLGFWQGLLWGGLIRISFFQNVTWCINSVSHLTGKAVYETGDESRNVTWFAILGFGEGYHNNHHAFPRSACFGMDKGQIFDTGWRLIRLLEKLNLIKDVVYPPSLSERLKRRLKIDQPTPIEPSLGLPGTDRADETREEELET